MSTNVPHLRPDLDATEIRSGAPIRGDTWQTLAGLTNWLNGHGAMLVPWCFPGHTVASGSTDVFRFYVKPKVQAHARIWRALLRGVTAAASAEIAAPTGATRTAVAIQTVRGLVTPVTFVELLTPSATAGEIAIDIKAVGGDVVVDALACYEQTRAELAANATDLGVVLESVRSRQPIVDLSNRSMPGVLDALDGLDARRASLVQWAVPDAAAASTTSGSYQALFESPVPVLAPVVNAAGLVCPYSVRCRVQATGGEVEVQATTTAGAVSATTSSASFTWLAVGTVSVASERLTDADGLPAGGFDTITIEIRKTTGTRIDISGVSVLRETLPQ